MHLCLLIKLKPNYIYHSMQICRVACVGVYALVQSERRVSDGVRPEPQDGESPAVLPQQQSDLIIVRVGVKGLVVLLVLHLILRGLPALPRVARLRGTRLRGALLPPLGASVLKPHLRHRQG